MADHGDALGLWLRRAPEYEILVAQFTNAAFAQQVRGLNPYTYRTYTPVPGAPAAKPLLEAALLKPAAKKRLKRSGIIAGFLLAVLLAAGCIAILAGMGAVLWAPGQSSRVETGPTAVVQEEAMAAVASDETGPTLVVQEKVVAEATSEVNEAATVVEVELEPTAVPEATETPEPTSTPQPSDTPAPTATTAPTSTPQPSDTPAPTATTAPTRAPQPTASAAIVTIPLTLPADGPVQAIAFSPQDGILASAARSGTVVLWDLASGEALHTLNAHAEGEYVGAFAVAFAPDGQTLASGGFQPTVKLWDVSTGSLQQELEGHDLWVESLAYAPDGQTLASGGADRAVILWAVATGQALHTLEGHTDWVLSVAFSPDGDLLASSSCAMLDASDNTKCRVGEIFLWDTATMERIRPFNNQEGFVYSLAFSPDGALLASAPATAPSRCGTWPQGCPRARRRPTRDNRSIACPSPPTGRSSSRAAMTTLSGCGT